MRFSHASRLPEPVDEVFGWHERPGAVERLTPPWDLVRVERPAESLAVGSTAVFRIGVGPLSRRYLARHVGYNPPLEFRDVQESGPFAHWEHRHRFEPALSGGTEMTDEVTYELPLGRLGDLAAGQVAARLRRMFVYRHDQVAGDLAAHGRARRRGARPMRIAVTGSTGLVGSALVPFLTAGGHEVLRVVRSAPRRKDEIFWDPGSGEIDAEALRGVDAVVHLAGASFLGRWNDARMRLIRDSRVRATRLLATALATLDDGPHTLVCASGVGYYGLDRRDSRLTEESGTGGGFLASVVRDWEAAAEPARESGVRVVHVRTGAVQSPRGGMLRVLLPLFLAGVGGRLGSGRQWLSWISVDDIVGLFHHALVTPELEGPLNGVAPRAVRNQEYAATLAGVLGRRLLVPLPAWGPRLLLGGQGTRELVRANQRVVPARAETTGYVFRHPDLGSALRHVLGRPVGV